jgi:hypothetical protein
MSTYDDDHTAGDDHTARLLTLVLTEEAARVDPDPSGLGAIQRRTTRTARRRARSPWVFGAAGAGLATAAVVTAVVILSQAGTPSPGPATGPVAGPQKGTATSQTMHKGVYHPSAPASRQLTMYYVGPPDANPTVAPRLYAETHTVQASGQAPDVAAVHEFLTSTPIDPDYRTGWPRGVDVTRISSSGGVSTIALKGHADLGTKPLPVPFDPSRTVAVQGLLETAGVHDKARFTYNGHPLKLVLYTSANVTAKPRSSLRAFVTIDNVVEGQTLTNPVTITVSGNVNEGTVNWQLLDAAGNKQADGYTTTSQGVWTQAKVPLGTLKPGTYTFKAFEASAATGRPTYVDDKTFTVN